MKRLENVKKQYEEVEIPSELDYVVQSTIQEYEEKKKKISRTIYKRAGKYSLIIVASVIVCFTFLLNTNQAFAKEMGEIPFLGKIVQVLTVRTYEETQNGIHMEGEVPGIQLSENTVVEETVEKKIMDVNEVIQNVADQYTKEATIRAEEYRQAFLETGGTEEEWKEHDIQIQVDYDILYQDETTLSFLFMGFESWTSAYAVREYYNIDLSTGEEITLQEKLGEGYEDWVNHEVMLQMEEAMKQDPNIQYWVNNSSGNGFTTVSKDTKFYLNKAGNVVLVFDKYEVAPGAMGNPEFEIVPPK